MTMLIYFRLLGYAVTVVMHVGNMISMDMVLRTDSAQDLFSKNPTIRFFARMLARYFTCWNFFNQTVYAVIGLVCDYLTLKHSRDKNYHLPKHLRRLRDTYFAAIVWPSTFLVTSVFWGLYALDRDLIFPEILDQVLTRTSNHIIHTAIVPVALWELVCRPRKTPRGHWWNIAHILFLYVLYHIVLFYTYATEREWIYPVYKRLLEMGRVYIGVFMTGTWLLLLVYYLSQWPLNRAIHGLVVDDKVKTR